VQKTTKTSLLLPCLVALGCLGLGVPCRAQATSTGDKAQIEALENRFIAAFRAKDINKIMAVYAPGSRLFVFDVTPPRQHVGWADYKKDWSDFLGQIAGPVQVELTDLAVTTDGQLGFGHSIQHVSAKMTDGKTMDITVRVSDAYQKLNGHWYIVEEHVSVPVDINTGQADLQSKP
jgi:ketosteroid isomerase-like protein